MILSQVLQGQPGSAATSQGEQSAVPLIEDEGAFLKAWSEQPREGDSKWRSVDGEDEVEQAGEDTELPDDVMSEGGLVVTNDAQRTTTNRNENSDQPIDGSIGEVGALAHPLPQMSAPPTRAPHGDLPEPDRISKNVKDHRSQVNIGQASQHLSTSAELADSKESTDVQTFQGVTDKQVLNAQVQAQPSTGNHSKTTELAHADPVELAKTTPPSTMNGLTTFQPKAVLQRDVQANELHPPRSEFSIAPNGSSFQFGLTNNRPPSATITNAFVAPDLFMNVVGEANSVLGHVSLLGAIEELSEELVLNSTTSVSLSNSAMNAANTVKTAAPTVVQQIAAALAQSSGQSTQIALNPEELGRVRISLSSNEAGLVVNIVAERPETADLMRRNIDSLLQDFSELGYDNPTFDFQSDGDTDGESPSKQSPTSSDGMSADVVLTQPEISTPRHTASSGLDLKL